MRRLLFRIGLALVLFGVCTIWIFPWHWARRTGGAGVGFTKPFVALWLQFETRVLERGAFLRFSRRSTREQFATLEARARRLELQLARRETAVAENRVLRKLVGLPPMPGWHYLAARVIARDPASWARRFRIGRGSRDGVCLGAAVLADGYLIGRISECDRTTAMVTTIADPACRISVCVGDLNAAGIMNGRVRQAWRQQPECLITFLPYDGTYRAGDVVRTSGLARHLARNQLAAAVIPKGLVAGRVIAADGESVATQVRGAYCQVRMQPLADFARHDLVAVVTPVGAAGNAAP